eukprot:6404472-Amphidinium_carterae.1
MILQVYEDCQVARTNNVDDAASSLDSNGGIPNTRRCNHYLRQHPGTEQRLLAGQGITDESILFSLAE